MFTILTSTIPAPDPLPIPAPPWLLRFLLLLTFFLHVLAMNFVLGGSIIAAVARLRAARDERAAELAKWIGKWMPTIVAAAITFGVAPLLFLQTLYGRLFFSSAVLMAWIWLAVVPIVIVLYYGTYAIAFRRKVGAIVAAVVALLLAGVAFIYSNNMTLMLRPEQFGPMYTADARGLQLHLAEATLAPRYLHMLLGAIAVAGMFVALYGLGRSIVIVRHGALWFIGATTLNVLTGIWWLGSLPHPVLLRFMGEDSTATLFMALGIVLGLASLATMAFALIAAEPRRAVLWSAGALAPSLMLMVLTRDAVRTAMLDLAGFKMTSWIAPQWDVIAIFAILLVAALGTTAWMATLLLPRKA